MMKIYPLPVGPDFLPARQNFRCPTHGEDKGVEQDFDSWLFRSEHLSDDRGGADWHYLGIYWNRYYINNEWGHAGLDELQAEINRLVDPDRPSFTICEYDLPGLQPFLDLRGLKVFTASRCSPDPALIDIPLLCSPHEARAATAKKWLACFNGNVQTDGIRIDMKTELDGRKDVYVGGQWMEPARYASMIAESYIGLAPRGQGGQSFRFYEVMQIGTVPLLLSDWDTRPFKRWLPWDEVSLHWPGAEGLSKYLDGLDKEELLERGRRARDMYYHCLAYGQWPRYVVRELERL